MDMFLECEYDENRITKLYSTHIVGMGFIMEFMLGFIKLRLMISQLVPVIESIDNVPVFGSVSLIFLLKQ